MRKVHFLLRFFPNLHAIHVCRLTMGAAGWREEKKIDHHVLCALGPTTKIQTLHIVIVVVVVSIIQFMNVFFSSVQ